MKNTGQGEYGETISHALLTQSNAIRRKLVCLEENAIKLIYYMSTKLASVFPVFEVPSPFFISPYDI